MFLKAADLDKEETCPHLTKFTILKFNVKNKGFFSELKLKKSVMTH